MIGILLYGPFELAPYSRKYMQILKNAGIEYDLIGWRREEKVYYTGKNVYMYEGRTAKRYSSPIRKILPSIGFRHFVKKIIRQKNYDMLIVLTTQTALIFSDLLLGKYRHKFIFDYRDKSYEYIKPYKMLVNAIVSASSETVISSPWFAEGLTDKKQYINVHNMQTENLSFRTNVCRKKDDGEKIIAGYVGALREFEYHKRLIDAFGNDKRFVFYTYGCGDDNERLAAYASKYSNTYVHGIYDEKDKYGIISGFDIMCYNYPSNFVNNGAIANKYYDSLIMKKPMFVNAQTHLGKFIAENQIGVSVPESCTGMTDLIYNWYKKMDAKNFSETCDRCLNNYISENEEFEKKVSETVLRSRGGIK